MVDFGCSGVSSGSTSWWLLVAICGSSLALDGFRREILVVLGYLLGILWWSVVVLNSRQF